MDAGPGVLADRLPRMGGGQAALVQRMAGFVQRRHQAVAQVVGVVARGDAHVGPGADGERVGGTVQPHEVGIEPDATHQGLAERLLGGDRERRRQRDRRRLARLQRPHPRQEFGRRGLIAGERRLQVAGQDAGLVTVHQRVIGTEPERRADRLPVFPRQLDHLGQERRDIAEAVGAAGLAPARLADRVGPGPRLDQRGRYRGGAIMQMIHQAEIGRLPFIEAGTPLLGLGKVVADRRRAQQFVGEVGDEGQLVGAVVRGTQRHHHRLIPLQDRTGLVDDRDAVEDRGQPLIGAVRGSATGPPGQRGAKNGKQCGATREAGHRTCSVRAACASDFQIWDNTASDNPAAKRRPDANARPRAYARSRFASGTENCGSVSQGNMIQVSWLTSVTKLSTSALPAGLA